MTIDEKLDLAETLVSTSPGAAMTLLASAMNDLGASLVEIERDITAVAVRAGLQSAMERAIEDVVRR